MRAMTKPGKDLILPPSERGQHDALELIETAQAGVMRARVKWERRDALLVYYHLGHLGRGDVRETRFNAAMKFRLDWYALGKEPRVTARYADFINAAGSPETWSDIRTRAARRYDRAALALGRRGLLALVVEVACQGEFKGRGRMKRLLQGLDILAKHA